MQVAQALKLREGQRVRCPAYRGDPAYDGTVADIGKNVYENLEGTKFIWVSVKETDHYSVWPSNLLG